jgi:hypothetical protein
MKRCPECDSLFPDTVKFCELDGATLSDASDVIEQTEGVAGTSSKSLTPLAAIAGLIIGVLLVLIYLVVSREKVQEPVRTSSSALSVAQQQLPSRPLVTQPIAVESPSLEPSPSPSPSAQPSPSPSPTPKPIELSSSPISTTNVQDKTGPVTIKLESGLTIEADEAWKAAEGIWYRKGGMVSLLNPKDIKTLEKKSVR